MFYIEFSGLMPFNMLIQRMNAVIGAKPPDINGSCI
jgi:hypothetical protein